MGVDACGEELPASGGSQGSNAILPLLVILSIAEELYAAFGNVLDDNFCAPCLEYNQPLEIRLINGDSKEVLSLWQGPGTESLAK